MVAVGCFLPLTTLPVYGDITFYTISEIDSIFVVVFALTTPLLVLLNLRKLTPVSTIAIWVILLPAAVTDRFKTEDGGVFGRINGTTSDPLKNFAADLFLNVTEFNWGGLVFLLGLILLTVVTVVAMLKSR